MYDSVKSAFETMLEMANDCGCVRNMKDKNEPERLDEANSFLVEKDIDGTYRVTVQCNEKTCVAEKKDGVITVIEGTDNDFMVFCEEFTLAW